MNIGWTELLLVCGILLLLFGPSKLPSLGKAMGESIRGFKKGLSGTDEEEKTGSTTPMSSSPEKLENQTHQADTASHKDKTHSS